MPKTTRSDGPSIAGGTPDREPIRLSGRDLEIGGPTAELITGSATIGTLTATTLTAASQTITNQTVTNLTATTATITGQTTVRGVPLAQYERMTFVCDQMRADPAAAATAGNTNGYPGWDFADGATQAVLIPWAPPRIGVDGSTHLFWNTFEIALVWYNLGAGSGAVRWQIEVFNYAIGIDNITEAAATTQADNETASAQNIQNAGVIGAPISLNPGFFGSEYKLRVARIGADGGDTLGNAARITHISFNRVT